jgi:hypothetical protein
MDRGVGVYAGVRGFGGIFIRGCAAESGSAVLNLHGGAHIGCGLTAEPDPV